MSCWTQIYTTFRNSVDPDQLASEDLDLHYLPISMQTCGNNPDEVICLAENPPNKRDLPWLSWCLIGILCSHTKTGGIKWDMRIGMTVTFSFKSFKQKSFVLPNKICKKLNNVRLLLGGNILWVGIWSLQFLCDYIESQPNINLTKVSLVYLGDSITSHKLPVSNETLKRNKTFLLRFITNKPASDTQYYSWIILYSTAVYMQVFKLEYMYNNLLWFIPSNLSQHLSIFQMLHNLTGLNLTV